MYVAPPPQSSVGSRQGRMDETPVTKRVYQIWRGSNKFFLGGRLIFGPDVRSLAMTLFLIVVPVTVFCSLVASELVDKFPRHLGIFIMAIAIIFTIYDLFLLLLTSARDPGIIPRNAHPPEPEYETGIPGWGDDGTSRYKLPRTTDVVVNGVTVKSKYCDTCMLYRPPRCSHCSICNNCVERFDHHCPWVGQCIGQRNYRYFFMFVFSTTILCIYVFSFCWVLIRKIMEEQQIGVGKAMLKTPASIVLIAYTFIAVWFVGGLTSFHTYLISTNQTTYENFRYRYDRNMNPYNKGVPQNFKEIFFTKMPHSKNNFRAKVQQDTTGFGVVSPSIHRDSFNAKMGKGGSDLEMGIKPSWSTVEIGASEDSQVQNAEGIDTRSVMQSRRSSWGRKSGSWEITPDILALAAGVGAEGNRAATKNSPGNND